MTDDGAGGGFELGVVWRQVVSAGGGFGVVGGAEDVAGFFEGVFDFAGCEECGC